MYQSLVGLVELLVPVLHVFALIGGSHRLHNMATRLALCEFLFCGLSLAAGTSECGRRKCNRNRPLNAGLVKGASKWCNEPVS
jgi:hypothetical protein